MILTPVDLNEIKKFYKRTKVQSILQEFQNSEYEAVRLDDHGYKNASTDAATFAKSISRFKMLGIKVITRNQNVYLIKEIENEQH